MKRRIVVCMLILFMVLTVSGCTDTTLPTNKRAELERETGVTGIRIGDTHWFEQKFTEQNHQRLVKSNPPTKTQTSLERENLDKRNVFLNDHNKIFYVYLISYGKIMGYYTAQGKISSVNSRLTQEEQVIKDPQCSEYNGRQCRFVVGSPQLDGSYGTNGDAIFFFTTEGAYVEWNAEYLVSDFPLTMSTPPILVREIE